MDPAVTQKTLNRSTCKCLSFIEQPLLVCWYVETFRYKLLHCGDLFIFSHLKDQHVV